MGNRLSCQYTLAPPIPQRRSAYKPRRRPRPSLPPRRRPRRPQRRHPPGAVPAARSPAAAVKQVFEQVPLPRHRRDRRRGRPITRTERGRLPSIPRRPRAHLSRSVRGVDDPRRHDVPAVHGGTGRDPLLAIRRRFRRTDADARDGTMHVKHVHSARHANA